MPVISWEPLTRGTIASADVGYISQTGNVKNYTVTYMDEIGNVIGTKKVNEGGGATFVPTATTTDDGYTIEYKNVVWLDSVGGDEVDLSSVTKDMTVYFGGEKITYVKVEKYSDASGYKRIVDLNKYIIADENGNIEFKIRLNGTNGSSFIIYEKTTWTAGEFAQWVDGNEWWTVKGLSLIHI